MNLKALITTLVLGSSSMASADVKVTGSVTVSLGGARPVAPNYRAPVVVAEPCEDPAPIYQPAPSRPVYHPAPTPAYHPTTPPIWAGPYFQITNTRVAASGSTYRGSFGVSKIKTAPRVTLRERTYGFVAKAPTQPWFDLTEATRIDNGRQFFNIGAEKGVFSKLKLQALGNGSSKITQVAIEFADAAGRTQVIKLNQAIHRTNATITLDLDGEYRSIKRVIVYGATDLGSAYKIQAM